MNLEQSQREEDFAPGDNAASGPDQKRRQILDGARQVFLRAGYDGASMGEIAKAAGVSKGTLYSYFASKEGLFERLILDERTSLAEALFRLDRETFSELMAGNIEIVRGVLHVLCERLRRVTSFAVTPK